MAHEIPDITYSRLIHQVLAGGDEVVARNHAAISLVLPPIMEFSMFPLVTIRKTAAMKAIREWEWFMTGKSRCPEEFARSWWKGQLDPEDRYIFGYGQQFRCFGDRLFDQIDALIDGLRDHPTSRRNLLTTWNPSEMSEITEINQNQATPTTCHSTMVQFFVRYNSLHMYSYQRSADLLLGLPHNLAQSWAFLLYMAHRTGHKVGRLSWQIGDAHIYNEPSHREVASAIASWYFDNQHRTAAESISYPTLNYNPTSDEFKASDFTICGEVGKPVVFGHPKLL